MNNRIQEILIVKMDHIGILHIRGSYIKQNGQIKHIPAVQGETYYADINVPHCVPESKSNRLHLLGCVSDPDDTENSETRHQHLGDSDQTWAEWKKDLGV